MERNVKFRNFTRFKVKFEFTSAKTHIIIRYNFKKKFRYSVLLILVNEEF